MKKQEAENLRIICQVIAEGIRHSESVLENVTQNLETNLRGLNLHKLPEYAAAMRAIEVYGSVAVTRFSEKYKDRCGSR